MRGPEEKKLTPSAGGRKKKQPEKKAHSMRTELSGIVIFRSMTCQNQTKVQMMQTVIMSLQKNMPNRLKYMQRTRAWLKLMLPAATYDRNWAR